MKADGTNIIIFIVIGLIILCCCLLILTSLLLIRRKKKTKSIKVDDTFMNTLIENYGGISNITLVEIENSRLKITVENLDIVKLDDLKEQAQSGIFVTGNTVKTLYKLSSEQIKKFLDERLKG